jgi:hypothetical protein
MRSASDDGGVIQALLQRLNEQKLPRLLAVKAKVDAGEPVAGEELGFLQQVFEDAERVMPLIDRHPEYQDLVARVARLYAEIAAKVLENEK